MEKKYLHCEIKAASNGDLVITATDETLDRYGEVVSFDAWDLSNYKKNPVLLVNHDYRVENIVGRAKNLKKNTETRALTFTPDFHNITELARNVSEMVKEKILTAVSVGFLPHAPMKDGDKVMNELLEISFVPVPANPNALALAMKSIDAIDEAQKKKIEEWTEKAKDPHSKMEGLVGDMGKLHGKMRSKMDTMMGDKAGDGMMMMSEMIDQMGDMHGKMDDTMSEIMDSMKSFEIKAQKTEVQTVICSKDKFDTAEKAKKWVIDHEFRADKTDETENSYRFRQFDPGACQDGSERTIDITDGVKAVICKKSEKGICEIQEHTEHEKISDRINEKLRSLGDELVNIKEGRVLSGKNRQTIEKGLTALSQAVEILGELLQATDPNIEKTTDPKGRDPKEEHRKKPKPKPYGKGASTIVRALQGINSSTNELLRNLK